MTFLAIDGSFVGRRLAYLPKGYHCVACLDNHPDIISCTPGLGRKEFEDTMREGLAVFVDDKHAVDCIIATIRQGHIPLLALQVLAYMVDANEAIHDIMQEVRKHVRD